VLSGQIRLVTPLENPGLPRVGTSGGGLLISSMGYFELSEYHSVGRPAKLHLVAARLGHRRRTDLEQHFNHFGGESLFGKLWLLPWCPSTARHHSPVGFGDRRCLDCYLVHAIDDCSLTASPSSRAPCGGLR
jgi:hypothetical protein